MDVAPDICVTNPLSLAAYLNFADVVNVCLEVEILKGGAFAVRGNAIALASWAGHLDIVTKLFDDGFDKETANDTRYLTEALIKASDRGNYEIVEFPMDHIPKPTNSFVWDPVLLCRAAEVGYETLVERFTKAGAGVNVPHEGATPLQYAARNGHESIVEFLFVSWR